MSSQAAHASRPWTAEDVEYLQQLVRENTSTGVMAMKLNRSESDLYAKAQAEGLSLKPTHQSPRG